jgi:hypothetical protein
MAEVASSFEDLVYIRPNDIDTSTLKKLPTQVGGFSDIYCATHRLHGQVALKSLRVVGDEEVRVSASGFPGDRRKLIGMAV